MGIAASEARYTKATERAREADTLEDADAIDCAPDAIVSHASGGNMRMEFCTARQARDHAALAERNCYNEMEQVEMETDQVRKAWMQQEDHCTAFAAGVRRAVRENE